MSARSTVAWTPAAAARIVAILALSCLLGTVPVAARELALVVGIDEYRFGADNVGPDRVRNLEGATNDARLIARTLRRLGAELPDERVLIGRDATAAAFRAAWEQLLADAGPGDGIIVTFAGHGGREAEIGQPFDESDGFDETLMFWDFDPLRPHIGRIADDELFRMLERAGGRRVTFVADACHSGGLTRGVARTLGRSRQGGSWDLGDDAFEAMPSADEVAAEDWQALGHVTYLTATEDESKVILEIRHDARPHGALSVGFAEGIAGAADVDGNGLILRRELEEYVGYRVATMSSRLQVPGFLPRGYATGVPVLRLGGSVSPAPAAPDADALEFTVVGAPPPAVLDGARHSRQAMLQFEVRADEVVAFHGTDEITRFVRTAGTAPWQSIVDRFRLLDAVDAAYDRTAGPPAVSLACDAVACDASHRRGEYLTLVIDRPRAGGEHLVVFNLAGSGEVQPLYPHPTRDEPSRPAFLPHTFGVDVGPPFGRDDVVAGFCRDEPEALRALIDSRAGRAAPSTARFIELSVEHGCQWGRYPVFTAP